MRNKRFSWKHTFVALAISFVVCLLIVVVMTTATKRDLPEFSSDISPPRYPYRSSSPQPWDSRTCGISKSIPHRQYPALMAVMVSSPRLVYPSAVKISDM